MAVIRLDLNDQLNNYVNSLSPFAQCKVGILGEDDSLSLMNMPGGNESIFYNGARTKEVQYNIMAKHDDPQIAPEFLLVLFQQLELLEELPSGNGSYDFRDIEITSLPALVAMDNQGFAIYQCSFSVNILIHKGVGL